MVSIEVTAPPATPSASAEVYAQNGSTGSTGSGSSKGRHRKGLSIDKIGIAKMFSTGAGEQTNGAVSRSPSELSVTAGGSSSWSWVIESSKSQPADAAGTEPLYEWVCEPLG